MSIHSRREANELFQTGKIPLAAAESAASDPFRVHVLKQLSNMSGSMEKLTTALGGNDLGTTGIVKRLANVEARQDEHEKKLVFWAGIVTTLSTIGSALAAWWAGHK